MEEEERRRDAKPVGGGGEEERRDAKPVGGGGEEERRKDAKPVTYYLLLVTCYLILNT